MHFTQKKMTHFSQVLRNTTIESETQWIMHSLYAKIDDELALEVKLRKNFWG
jgi:hypothetical protein